MSQGSTDSGRTQSGSDGAAYDETYYRSHCGDIPYERSDHWLGFFGQTADELIAKIHPRTVFDAGCGWGFLVEAFHDRGVEAYGVDLSPYAIDQVRADIQPFCRIGSVADPIPGHYDLITCIETLEHISEDEACLAIRQMAAATECVFFSSTPSDLNEPTHINVRPVIYWLKLFAEHEFFPDLLFDGSFLAPHAVLLRRGRPVSADDSLAVCSNLIGWRMDRTLFLQRHNRIGEFETQVASLEKRVASAQSELVEARLSLNASRTDLETMRSARAELRAENLESKEALGRTVSELAVSHRALQLEREHLRESQAALDVARDELQAARSRENALVRETSILSAQLYQEQHLVYEWATQNAELEGLLTNAAGQQAILQSQLNAIVSSPGWQTMENYRAWLERTRWHRPWLHSKWEALMQSILARTTESRAKSAPSDVEIKIPFVPAVNPLPPPPPMALKQIESFEPVAVRDYETWIRKHEPEEYELDLQRRMGTCLSYQPKFSVILPVYRAPLAIVQAAIDSVIAQTYQDWELCISVPRPDNPEVCALVESLSVKDSRIKLTVLAKNEGISGNSNRALRLATGEFIALLDHDDTLAPHAFFQVAKVLNHVPAANFLYSDKDQLTEDGSRRLQPLFKPRWSPEIMLNANYLTHLCVMRTEHVRELGGWRPETDGAQDWDLFLRVIHRYGQVVHVPGILYHWRQLSTSVAGAGMKAKPYAEQGQVRAVKDYCRSLNLDVDILSNPDLGLRIVWSKVQRTVSVIYLSSASPERSIAEAERLLEGLSGVKVEVLVPLDSDLVSATKNVKVVAIPNGASISERMQTAVERAGGEFLVFLDSNVKPIEPDWLAELTGPLQLDGVGVVGARLLDSISRTLRHCGIVFTRDGSAEHVFAGSPDHLYDLFGGASWYRNWSAVSGACFAVPRQVWEEVGGLRGDLLHPRLDVHFCLKVREVGKRIVYTPFARFLQAGPAVFEAPVHPISQSDNDRVQSLFPEGDPYFHPDLECRHGQVKLHFRTSLKERARENEFAAEAMALTRIYDCNPEQVERSRALQSRSAASEMKSVLWLLPDFSNAFYGGIHTLLRFADAFRRTYGTQNHICVIGHRPERHVRSQLARAFPDLVSDCRVTVCSSQEMLAGLPPSDAAVCSLWTTAYDLLKLEQPRKKFYFIQDDEALFYPAGSTSALVEATYRFGFHGICNTPSLLRSYQTRGGRGMAFTPQINRDVFHSGNRKAHGGPPYTLFCYARPGHPRNCFELATAALRLLKARLGDDLVVFAAGAEWAPEAYGLESVVRNLGLLDYQSTGALYRMCDAGLVMMMTRHPSYLPLELMGCGALVVTNRNPDTGWLLHDEENCLLADSTPSSLAQRLEEGLRNVELRSRIVERASAEIADFRDWDEEIRKIHRYMSDICSVPGQPE